MLTSLELANHFGLKLLNGDLESLKRRITVAELDRPGVELLGIFQFHEKDRIMLIGHKETALIKDSDPNFVYLNALKICSKECPAVIITHGDSCPEPIMRAAKETNCPIFSSDADTSRLSSDMYIYLAEALAPKTAVHACLMEIYGIGVLILGESGIGKSEISLDLIKKGHRLIADDRVDIRDVRGKLIGTCPESIYGMMEVRGIGIIDIRAMYGVGSVIVSKSIDMVIHMEKWDSAKEYDRLGLTEETVTILGVKVPYQTMPVRPGRNLAIIIEVAARNLSLKRMGYSAAHELDRRLNELIAQNSGNNT